MIDLNSYGAENGYFLFPWDLFDTTFTKYAIIPIQDIDAILLYKKNIMSNITIEAAKKSFEAGVEINGEMTYKGSDAHKAAVTGDTVGDPFKDTSGPSMNILIKLTCLIGLVIAPILGGHAETGLTEQDVQMEMNVKSPELAQAVITYTTTVNGETKKEEKTFKGTAEEVKVQLEAFENTTVKSNKNGSKVVIEKVEINK